MKRFWDKVQKTENCWNWLATKRHGYGSFKYKKRMVQAHRFSWKLYFGEISEGLDVCHRCDKPACVRPDHLFLGTAHDNVIDSIKKHRFNLPGKSGHKAWNRNFTAEEAQKIRKEYKTSRLGYKKLGKKYGVANTVIRNVIKNPNWFKL